MAQKRAGVSPPQRPQTSNVVVNDYRKRRRIGRRPELPHCDGADADKVMASDLVASLAPENEDGDELVNLRNARDLAQASYCAEQMIRANRADSTIKSYDQKIHQWKQWCADRKFDDYDTVTERKLFHYMNSEIIPAGVQTKGKRYGTALSESGLDGNIKPIIALYKVHFPWHRC